jgi:hypothetical protein
VLSWFERTCASVDWRTYMQACLDRCRSAIFEIMVIVPLRIERQGAGSKTGCNHVGEDGARLGEVEGGECWVHRGLP